MRWAASVLLLAGLLATAPAWATLGEAFVAPPGGGKTLQAGSSAPAPYAQYVWQTAEGVTVREYAGAGGIVFAVSWSGAFKPDLQALLGRHFAAFAAAPRDAGGASARATRRIDAGSVVVDSGGRPRAFFGRAWVPALVPSGVDVRALP